MFFYFMGLKPENYGFLIFNDNNAIIKIITTVIFLFLEQIFKKRIAMLKE